jgi:hypothetical protein
MSFRETLHEHHTTPFVLLIELRTTINTKMAAVRILEVSVTTAPLNAGP